MQLITAIAPVILISMLGVFLRRFNFLSESGQANLNNLVFSILIPALLFNGVLKADLSGLNFSAYLLAYFVPLLVLYGVCFWALSLLKVDRVAKSVLSTAGMYGNLTVIGIPICFHFFGERALLPMSVVISCHSFILFSISSVLAETQGFKWNRAVGQVKVITFGLVKNPITMTLVVGLGLNALGFRLPDILAHSFSLLGQAATPLAFLVLGATLSQFGIKVGFGKAVFLSVFKLLVLPACIWFSMSQVWHIEGLWLQVGVVVAALPVGVATQVLARRYNSSEGVVASSIILSTVLSLFTIPLIVFLLGA